MNFDTVLMSVHPAQAHLDKLHLSLHSLLAQLTTMAKQLTSLLGMMESSSPYGPPSQAALSEAVLTALAPFQQAFGLSRAFGPVVPIVSLFLAGYPVPGIRGSSQIPFH